MQAGSYAAMIAAHLNAPYGPVVTPEQVVAVLRAGSLAPVGGDPVARAILGALFVECAGGLIADACAQSRIDLQQAHNLYKSILAEDLQPPVYRWEEAVSEILC